MIPIMYHLDIVGGGENSEGIKKGKVTKKEERYDVDV